MLVFGLFYGGAMGRPRKSDAEKIARGTAQKCRMLPPPAAGTKLAPDECPKYMRADAKKAWAAALTYAPEGLLQVTDAALLERWARDYALYRKYERELEDRGVLVSFVDEEGVEHTRVNPLFKVVESLKKSLNEMEKNLGFSPASRARVRAGIPEAPREKGDFDDF